MPCPHVTPDTVGHRARHEKIIPCRRAFRPEAFQSGTKAGQIEPSQRMKTSTLLPIRCAAVIAAAFFTLTASAQTTIKHADKSFVEKAAKAGQ